jgi:Frag1/DRAM/Sfk1 family
MSEVLAHVDVDLAHVDVDLVPVDVDVNFIEEPLNPEIFKIKKARLRTPLTPGWFFAACAALAFGIAVSVVIFVVVFRYKGLGHTVCRDWEHTNITHTSPKLPTISDSVLGCEAETFVSAAMPVYSFLRGFQILGEHWTLMYEVSERLDQNAQPVSPAPWTSAGVRLELKDKWYARHLYNRPTLRKRLAITVTVLSAVAQYSLILLLAVRSEVALGPHIAFTVIFVIAYIVYAVLDTYLRLVSQPRRYKGMMVLRLGLLLVACVAACVFLYYAVFDNISTEIVAKSEYVLSAAILAHGVTAAFFLWDLPLYVHSRRKAYYSGPVEDTIPRSTLARYTGETWLAAPYRCRTSSSQETPLLGRKSAWPEATLATGWSSRL